MKKHIQKIIACMIALAMIIGNFAGMGAPVAKAAETDVEDNYITFDVQVVDENDRPVQGVELQLYRKNYNTDSIMNFESPTDNQGKTVYRCQNEEMFEESGYAVYYELQLKEGSEYEFVDPTNTVKVWFGEGSGEDLYTTYTCINYVSEKIINNSSANEWYDGELVTVKVRKKASGSETEEEQFLEGVVKQDDSLISKKIMVQLSSVDLSGTPVDMQSETNENGEFRFKINDIKDGVYKLQPALGSGYTYVGSQPMRVEIDTRKEEEKNIKYVSKVDGADYSGGQITLSVVANNSPVITGVAAETQSVDEKGGKVTLTVTGSNLPDTLYYKKYYVKNDSNVKNDILLNKETAQPVPAQGGADKKTIEISLPNAQEYVGTADYSLVTAWKIGVDTSADGHFLAGNRSGKIEIKKAPVKQPDDDSNTKDPETPEKPETPGTSEIPETPGTSENPGTSEPVKKPETTKKPETSKTKKKVTKVSKITISGSSKSIAAGKKIKLTAKVSPAKATNKAVKWKTSNKKYATVDQKGNVTLKKAGAGKTVTVTATAADGSGKKATYKIKIMKNAVKSISLKANKSVKAGKSLKVKATVKTTGKKANKTLKWTTSNKKYATVSAKGLVKTKKAGKGKTVKITATSTDGSNKKKTIKIKIK